MTFEKTPDHEQKVKKVKKYLEGWRMVLLSVKSLLLWEQQWHPLAIFGFVSTIYFSLWLLDLNTLTTFAVLGFMVNFVDFIVPIISKTIYGVNSWTGQKEKIFEDICTSLVMKYYAVVQKIQAFYSLRERNPSMYHITSIGLFLGLVWVSSSVSTIFLFYVLTVVMTLWPGLQNKGVFNLISNMSSKTLKSE